jgi:2,3-bisphosphoglycerate-dependent phosphoglycerate mutase
MDIEKTVYFVRHAQSVDNAAPVFQSLESPLSETGLRQARLIAARVSKLSFEALIASPLRRAKETAAIIAQAAGMAPEYSELFVERIRTPLIGGKPYNDKEASALWQGWQKDFYTPGIRMADGESFGDIIERADAALAFLKARTERSLVVVTHGYFARTIIARILLGDLLSGELFQRFQRLTSMENTALTILRYHGAFEEEPCWRLWTHNDCAHLD